MRSHWILCWQIMVAAACLGQGSAIAFQGPNSDLLDPSFDQPLAQYQSTAAEGFRPKPAEAIELPPLQIPSAPLSSAGGSGNGDSVLLAPNPLADLHRRSFGPPAVDQATRNPSLRLPSEGTPFKATPGRKSFSLSENPSKLKPKSPSKKPAKKKVAAKKKPKKQLAPRQAEIDYAIYRDLSPLPIDPRKPNSPCTKSGGCQCSVCQSTRTGLHGRPHQPQEPGGYQCGKNCPHKRPEFSVYWPKPLSVRQQEHRSSPDCQCQQCGGGKRKVNDLFDGLVNFRLINYQRTDNGYCGPGADPYGCLGESKISGVGFRVPSEPVAAAYPLR